MASPLTFEQVSALLRVEGPHLVWRTTRGKGRAGARAGSVNRRGYIKLVCCGRDLQAHRVVWLLERGEWPPGVIDHINGQTTDNRIENLRLATPSQNNQNRRSASRSTPYKGVTRHADGKFQVYVGNKYLGLYSTAEAAARAYDDVAKARYGEFARLNFGAAAGDAS